MKYTLKAFNEMIDALGKGIKNTLTDLSNFQIEMQNSTAEFECELAKMLDEFDVGEPASSIDSNTPTESVGKYAGASIETINGLLKFESDLRESLKNITFEKLDNRRYIVPRRLAEISSNSDSQKIGSRQWVMLQQWLIRKEVYEPIWQELNTKHLITSTLPERLDQLKHFLHEALDDVTYENLLLRQKTAEGYIERLMPWAYSEGTPEWAELHEWHVRIQMYKLKMIHLQNPDEFLVYNRIRRMLLPDQVPNYNPSIHNYSLEQYYKLQLLITTFKAPWGYGDKWIHHMYSSIHKDYTHLYAELYLKLESIFNTSQCEFFLIEGDLLRFKYHYTRFDICDAYGAKYIPDAKAWKFDHQPHLYAALHSMQKLLTIKGKDMRILDLQTLVLSHQPPAPNSNQ